MVERARAQHRKQRTDAEGRRTESLAQEVRRGEVQVAALLLQEVDLPCRSSDAPD